MIEQPRNDPSAILVILALGVAGALATVLTGGVTGPLAIWCLAPLAAAAVMRKIDRLALGAAVSLAAVGLAALCTLTMTLPAPGPVLAYVLSVLALTLAVVGLGAGLVILRRGAETEERRRLAAEVELRRGLETARAREAAAEQAKTEAEAQNAGKSRFLANMSHELRTPLNAIMGFSDIMRQKLFGDLSDRYAEYAALIHDSGGHLLDLINDVLDMSKIEAERFELARETFDVRDPVAGVLRLMRGQADRAGVQLRGLLPKDHLDVLADRRAVKQIALNLISNALKFTPRGGSVNVTVQADGDLLELIVADTGVGIGAEDLERLGRPYEQVGEAAQKIGGTGLGLSLVRSFAELHGGTMEIESRLGEGTTVAVRLPVLEKSAALVDA